MRRIRLIMALANVVILATGLTIHALGSGPFAQWSGTALYTSIVYGTTVFLWPRISPIAASVAAIGFSWAVEVFQLSGIPATLSAHSLIARLVLGVAFDFQDILWYPVGVLPMVALHIKLTRTRITVSGGP